MSGKRFLNSSARPFPITPTQLTVLTRVCAWDSNMSPTKTRTISPPSAKKEQVRIQRQSHLRSHTTKSFPTLPTRHMGTCQISDIDEVRHQNLGAFYGLMSHFLNRVVRVRPIAGEYKSSIYHRESRRRRAETHIVARGVSISDDHAWQIENIQAHAHDTERLMCLLPPVHHGVSSTYVQVNIFVQWASARHANPRPSILDLCHGHGVVGNPTGATVRYDAALEV